MADLKVGSKPVDNYGTKKPQPFSLDALKADAKAAETAYLKNPNNERLYAKHVELRSQVNLMAMIQQGKTALKDASPINKSDLESIIAAGKKQKAELEGRMVPASEKKMLLQGMADVDRAAAALLAKL